MRKLTMILALLWFANASSQPFMEWQHCYGGSSFDYLNVGDTQTSVISTSDGGFVMAGWAGSNDGDVTGNHGDFDYWVVKTDSSGNIQWQRALGGSSIDVAYCVRQTFDGGYIIAGSTSSTDGDVTFNHGSSDFWIVNLNSDGEIIWQQTYGGSGSDIAYSIKPTSDGGYIVAGYTNSADGDVSTTHGFYDSWVLKLDSDGLLAWQNTYGGSDEEVAKDIIQTIDGGYVIAGYTFSNDDQVLGNHGNGDYWITKINSTGVIEWQHCYGGSDFDYANSIQQTDDGGFIVGGTTTSFDGDITENHSVWPYVYDGWIIKLSIMGNLEWERTVGGRLGEQIASVRQTLDGNYIAAGNSRSNDEFVAFNHGASDAYVVMLSSEGTFMWGKSLGGTLDDSANGVEVLPDGYIIAGTTYSNNGNVSGNQGAQDFWLFKLNPLQGIAEPCLNASGQSCDLNSDPNLAAWKIIEFNLGNETGTLLSNGSSCSPNGYGDYYDYWSADVAAGTAVNFFAKTQSGSDGAYNVIGKLFADWNKDNDFDDVGELVFESLVQTYQYVSGDFQIPTNASGDVRLRMVVTAGTQIDSPCKVVFGEIEDYKLNIGVLSSQIFSEDNSLSIFPNPAHDILNIRGLKPTPKHIEICDIYGKVIHRQQDVEASIDVSKLSAGLYFITIDTESERMYLRFVKK